MNNAGVTVREMMYRPIKYLSVHGLLNSPFGGSDAVKTVRSYSPNDLRTVVSSCISRNPSTHAR